MTKDTQTIVARAAGGTIDVRDARLALDEGWAPYAQATLECAYDPAILSALDPREDVRVSGALVQDFGDSDTAADLTTEFSGGTAAAITAAWAGLHVRDITAMHNRPWNAGTILPSSRRAFDLTLRGRRVDHDAKTITLTLSSDEGLLQDYALVSTVSYQPVTTSVRDLVVYVLAKIGRVLQPGTDDGLIEAASAEWLPGEDAWSYLQPLLQTAALRLWCDERRRWFLTSDSSETSTDSTLALSYLGTITDAEDDIDRDGDWFDAVVCVYEWTDATGARRRAYDTAESAGYSKVKTFRFETPYPGQGAAARLLARAIGRGRQQTVRAVSDFTAAPGRPVTVSTPDAEIQSGMISAVSWELPSAEMQVKTRGLVDTPWWAWVLVPEGYAWEDVPVGEDWTEWVTEPEGI